MLEHDSLTVLASALARLDAGFSNLPALAPQPVSPAMQDVLFTAADRLHQNFPYFHPLYAGQMLKPPHPVARTAYALAMWLNPNNHALDGGRASSALEVEAVAELASMFGWPQHLGHLTSGGTMANLEALWVASRLKPIGVIVASDQAHYTHQRITGVLDIPFEKIASDSAGRMDVTALAARLRHGNIGTVVVTFGTTACGAIDPLPEILALQKRYGFRIHVDAAYGGYFTLAANLSPEARAAADALVYADSIVIDPHKHGLQPYGCGCVLFRDPAVGRFYKHDSPYTYFSSSELHLGEITLECSRAGAAAVALWATQRLFPLVRGGEFARMLENSRAAALRLHSNLAADQRFIPAYAPELDIVCWAIAAPTIEQSSTHARAIFERAAAHDLHLALVDLPAKFFARTWPRATSGSTVTCLRSVLMKPEHLAWLDEIFKRLSLAADEVLQPKS
jgi:tyrosine decarboxylase / aspartate 1-decarboxylase